MKRVQYHFIEEKNILKNEKRVKILSYIYNNSGCTMTDASVCVGSECSVFDHIEKLRMYGLIRKERKMNSARLYPNFIRIDCLKSYGLDPKYKDLFNESKIKENLKDFPISSFSDKKAHEQAMKISKNLYENAGRKEAQKLSAEERLILNCMKEYGYSYVKDISEKTGIDLAEVIYYLGNMKKLVGFEEEKGRKKYFAKQ